MPIGAQEGVEIVPVTDGVQQAVFVLNHNSHTIIVPVDGTCMELIKGEETSGQIELKPYDVAILQRKSSNSCNWTDMCD